MSSRRIPFPFVPVPCASWRSDLDAIDRAVLGVFAGHAMRAEVFAVGPAEMRNKTGHHERSCERARDKLIRLGLIQRVATGGGRGKSSRYALGPSLNHGATPGFTEQTTAPRRGIEPLNPGATPLKPRSHTGANRRESGPGPNGPGPAWEEPTNGF